MSIVDDLDSLLIHFERIRSEPIFRTGKKTNLSEVAFADSPISMRLNLKHELENDLEAIREMQMGQTNLSKDIQPEKKKTAVHIFQDSSSSGTVYQFEKYPIDDDGDKEETTKTKTSGIGEALRIAAEQSRAAAEILRSRTINIKVFTPNKEAIKLKVDPKMAVGEVIKIALQQYEDNLKALAKGKSVRMNLNPAAYILRFAEDDGTVDEDMPLAMGRTQEIGQFKGWTVFRLVQDTSVKIVVSTTNDALAPMALLKVILPGENGFISVAYKQDMTMKQTMDVVCKKYIINDPSKLAFEFEDGGGPPGHIDMEKTMGDIAVKRIRLVHKFASLKGEDSPQLRRTASRTEKEMRKKELKSMKQMSFDGMSLKQKGILKAYALEDLKPDPKIELKPNPRGSLPVNEKQSSRSSLPIFGVDKRKSTTESKGLGSPSSRHSKSSFEYFVVKTKNGVKQERIMKIDKKRILFKTAEPKGKPPKNPERKIDDILKVESGEKPHTFTISYLGGSVVQYESAHSEMIVTKLNAYISARDK